MRPFDVLMLGGGTADCVLAAPLSKSPERSVCLVEAAPAAVAERVAELLAD